MKYLSIVLITIFMFESSPELQKVRNEFPNITSEEQADQFIEGLKNDDSVEASAYVAAMNFMKSNFVKFPFTKLKYFKLGKKQLDALIAINPDNIEMRYIRFLMQKQIPDFLGYGENIEEDFKVIISNIENYNLDQPVKLKIVNTMLLVDNLTPEEKDALIKIKKIV